MGYAVLMKPVEEKPSASRDLPESTKTASLGGYDHGKY
jgi:hypothetical protein